MEYSFENNRLKTLPAKGHILLHNMLQNKCVRLGILFTFLLFSFDLVSVLATDVAGSHLWVVSNRVYPKIIVIDAVSELARLIASWLLELLRHIAAIRSVPWSLHSLLREERSSRAVGPSRSINH